MPELREEGSYPDKADYLRDYLVNHYELHEMEFDTVIDALIEEVIQSIERGGKIPSYSYTIIVDDLLVFNNESTEYLALHCSFMPIEDKIDDLVINHGHYLFPDSANSIMNLDSGIIDCFSISYSERTLT